MTYSRFVRWLKIGLPLIALAILSAVFLLPKDRGFDAGLIYSTADLVALGEGMTVSNPRFTGATKAGEPFVVAADNAVPDGPDPEQIVLARPRASIDQKDRSIVLTAREGELRPKDQRLELSGDVRVETTDGFTVRTNWVEADVRRGEIRAPGAVTAKGPQGEIRAGSFRAERADSNEEESPAANQGLPSTSRFWFENGVKVTYAPAPRGAAAGASGKREPSE